MSGNLCAVGREHAMEGGEVHPRLRNEGGEPRNEIKRLEDDVRGAVPVGCALKEHGSGKRMLLCDSFQGLPAFKEGVNEVFKQGQFRVQEQGNIYKLIERFGLKDTCVVYEGWFADTLHTIPADQRFCFAHFDVDLYEPAAEFITKIYPKLVDGGILAFDEYAHVSPGVRLAVNEHVSKTGEVMHLGPISES